MTARLYKLTELHQKLDEAVRHEIARRAPDQFRIMALKRRKLRVKDLLLQVTRMTRSPNSPSLARG